jgi:hypothetical protein
MTADEDNNEISLRENYTHSVGFILNPTIWRSIDRQPTAERELPARTVGWKVLSPMLGY